MRSTLSNCKGNPPLHFLPYKHVYVIKVILPTPIFADTCGGGLWVGHVTEPLQQDEIP
jgi:hypothetical protein